MRFISAFLLTFFCNHLVFANPVDQSAANFQPKNANKQLDQISLQLSVQNLNINNLNTAVDTLVDLTKGAEDCLDETKEKLDNLDIMLKQGHDTANANTKSADFIYLTNERKKWADRQAQCRLFIIRSKEAISTYKTAIAALKQEETLERGVPLWKLAKQLINWPADVPYADYSSITMPPMFQSIFAWGVLIFSTLLISTFLLFRALKTRFAHRYLRSEKIHFSYVTIVAGCLMVIVLFTYLFVYTDGLDTSNPLLAAVQPMLIYLVEILFILFIFKLKKTKSLFGGHKLNITFFKSFALWFVSLYQLKKIGAVFVATLKINPFLVQFNQVLYLLFVITVEIYFTYRFCQTHQSIHFVKAHQRFIRRAATTLLLSAAILEIFGYHILATQLIYSSLITTAILFVMILTIQGLNNLYQLLKTHQPTKKFIMQHFNYQNDEVFTEFLILRTTAQIAVIIISILLIGSHWDYATDTIDLSTQLLNGIHIANLTLYPTRLLAGVIVFCVLYLVFRFISTAISRQQQFEDDEEETQVAIASIFTYIGFGLAVISGLLVAGFDFTALAIVAGALSVGIGLGLQSIVNNFVSGLILLIEKPIKPGDRINIEGIEGCVKKISVRSTLILTPSREDIIIPNSDLITKKVTNYTYHDRYLLIHCDIKVNQNNDIDLVQKLLLQVAKEHDDVIKNNRNKPSVLLTSFDDKTIVFQLWCLIKDAHNKSSIQSELNFAIHRLFKEHQINFSS